MKKLAFALGILALAACARPVAPEGGPKDNTPPQLVPEKSTPNLSTRFEAREFKLSFDEWVTLQEVGAQVLVSPPMVKRPEVTLKGRTVAVKFDKDEVLRPNTTYTINFGTAVKDLHEGNPAKDLRFVFSTGDVIDSLSVTGIVVDAFTAEPLENISILLYDTFEDSIVCKERPYYMARSDKGGQFSIPNVRAGAFKCVAIGDTPPSNLKWEDNERIGFPDSLVQVTDSFRGIPAIRVFTPIPAMSRRNKEVNQYGLVKLGYSGAPDTITLEPADLPGLRWLREQKQDTLLLWYDLADSIAWQLLAGADTIAVPAFSRTEFLESNVVAFEDERTAAPAGRRSRTATPAAPAAKAPPRTIIIPPNKPVQLRFNQPLTQVDTALCRIIADSVDLRDFDLRPDTSSPRALLLHIDWQYGHQYTLLLLPGAVTDFYGTPNADTLQRIFLMPEEKQLGDLRLSVERLQTGSAYVLRLMNGNNLEEERLFTADSTTARFVFQKLQPVTYSVQLIEDQNNNHRWDAGDYFSHRQPEPVFIKKLEPLRANWEVEATMQAGKETGERGK